MTEQRCLIYMDAVDNTFKLPASEYEAIAYAVENSTRFYHTQDHSGCPLMLNLKHFVCMFITNVRVTTEKWIRADDNGE